MTAQCDDSVPMPHAHGMPWCSACQRWHHETAGHVSRPRRDIPKSGSRREAIEILTACALDCKSANDAQTFELPMAGNDKIQAALNYMVMHDGW